ncbi:hypothetical protein EGM88_07365 [Aureibaculum marinum]|uniref:Uncharacterized protein n=1 Tax=Aureibaculum marinum TaxID=2487930 RepID=A0A3N4NYN2_9FLAO|nr:hypothetical protein [Aureibaculum marinum]RPD97976.1 hypothetical protein EGM88_07365 [Aureibaculum marinum]
METKILHLSDLKFNLETWRRELKFHANEMDIFEQRLEDIASREFNNKALVPLENFQNRILLEKDAISKLKHRCKSKIKKIKSEDSDENIDITQQFNKSTLREDMRTFLKMHYELKEEMMDYFLEWL